MRSWPAARGPKVSRPKFVQAYLSRVKTRETGHRLAIVDMLETELETETVEEILGPGRTLAEFLPKALSRDDKPLGTGSFSAVFAHPSNPRRVVKVTCDEGSYRYLTAGMDGRHTPRVYKAALLGQNEWNLPIFAIEMERLGPCTQSRYFDEPLRSVCYKLYGLRETHHAACVVDAGGVDKFVGWADILRTVAGDRQLPRSVTGYFRQLASFFQASEEEAESRDELLMFDGTASRNVGVRDDGTFVFFDPVCGYAAYRRAQDCDGDEWDGHAPLRY